MKGAIIKKNLLSILIIALLTIVLMGFIATLLLTLAEGSKLDKEISSRCKIIDEFARESKVPLSKDSVVYLIDKQNRLKNVHVRLKLALISPLNDEIPKESIDALQFKERLIQTQKKLREDSQRHSLLLPNSLGFVKYETELSKPSEIPALIRRLKVLEELIYIMTLSGVYSLKELSFTGEDIEKEKQDIADQEAYGIYSDIPLSFKISCTFSELINFMYGLRASPFIFTAEDLDIKRTRDILDKDEAAEGMLEASFSISAITFN